MQTRLAMTALALAPALGAIFCPSAQACTATLSSNGQAYSTIGAAVTAANKAIDTISVDGTSGTCNENVFVDNSHVKLIIQGVAGTSPTILAANPAAPAIDLRGKVTAVENMTVKGGSQGIAVQRNANGYLLGDTVQQNTYSGIIVDQMAYAVILGSTIQNNGKYGISVYQLAGARIGIDEFEYGWAGTYQPNLIQSNGLSGIFVLGNSSVLVYANTIQANGGYGIEVAGLSSVTTGGNNISANTQGGIFASFNSAASIGVDVAGKGFPDTSTTVNGGFGILCKLGAVVGGHLGSTTIPLNGASGPFPTGTNPSSANYVDPSCPAAYTNLLTP